MLRHRGERLSRRPIETLHRRRRVRHLGRCGVLRRLRCLRRPRRWRLWSSWRCGRCGGGRGRGGRSGCNHGHGPHPQRLACLCVVEIGASVARRVLRPLGRQVAGASSWRRGRLSRGAKFGRREAARFRSASGRWEGAATTAELGGREYTGLAAARIQLEGGRSGHSWTGRRRGRGGRAGGKRGCGWRPCRKGGRRW